MCVDWLRGFPAYIPGGQDVVEANDRILAHQRYSAKAFHVFCGKKRVSHIGVLFDEINTSATPPYTTHTHTQ